MSSYRLWDIKGQKLQIAARQFVITNEDSSPWKDRRNWNSNDLKMPQSYVIPEAQEMNDDLYERYEVTELDLEEAQNVFGENKTIKQRFDYSSMMERGDDSMPNVEIIQQKEQKIKSTNPTSFIIDDLWTEDWDERMRRQGEFLNSAEVQRVLTEDETHSVDIQNNPNDTDEIQRQIESEIPRRLPRNLIQDIEEHSNTRANSNDYLGREDVSGELARVEENEEEDSNSMLEEKKLSNQKEDTKKSMR